MRSPLGAWQPDVAYPASTGCTVIKTQFTGINPRGEAIGDYTCAEDPPYLGNDFLNGRAFFRDRTGGLSPLTVPGAARTLVIRTNASGAFVGIWFDDEDHMHGFVGSLNLVQNSAFDSGTLHWLQFATPDMSYIVSQVTGGVFEYYRVPPPPGTTNQAVIFQETSRADDRGGAARGAVQSREQQQRAEAAQRARDRQRLHRPVGLHVLAGAEHGADDVSDADAHDEGVGKCGDLLLRRVGRIRRRVLSTGRHLPQLRVGGSDDRRPGASIPPHPRRRAACRAPTGSSTATSPPEPCAVGHVRPDHLRRLRTTSSSSSSRARRRRRAWSFREPAR